MEQTFTTKIDHIELEVLAEVTEDEVDILEVNTSDDISELISDRTYTILRIALREQYSSRMHEAKEVAA